MKILKKLKIYIWIFYLGGAFQVHAHNDTGIDFPQMVRKITPSVVAIATYSPLRSPRVVIRGTGFVVHDGYHIITNAHVLPRDIDMGHNEKIKVMIGRGNRPDLRTAEVILIDQEHDLALLKVTGNKLPNFKLGSGATVPAGTEIAVTGYPIGSVLGLYAVTHKGIVASVTPIVIPQPTAKYLDARIINKTRYDVYQLDLTAYPGNSGSPMYNVLSGEIEGILNSVSVKGTKENALTNPSGISFAIPVIHLHNLIRNAGLK